METAPNMTDRTDRAVERRMGWRRPDMTAPDLVEPPREPEREPCQHANVSAALDPSVRPRFRCDDCGADMTAEADAAGRRLAAVGRGCVYTVLGVPLAIGAVFAVAC